MNSLPPSFPPERFHGRPHVNEPGVVTGKQPVRHEVPRGRVADPLLEFAVHSGAATMAKPVAGHANQDRYVNDPVHRVYAVFDGIGGDREGGEAAQAAAEYIHNATIRGNLGTLAVSRTVDLQDVMYAQARVLQGTNTYLEGIDGGTTATLAEVVESENQIFAVWSSIGDSRIYRHRLADFKMQQLSRDEGTENVLAKYLKYDAPAQRSSIIQYHIERLTDGDGLILVTDGVTGDRGYDLMEPHELERHYLEGVTPTEAAINLVRNARKIDDRTAVVVHIGD